MADSFTTSEFIGELLVAVRDKDADAVASWLKGHIRDNVAAGELMYGTAQTVALLLGRGPLRPHVGTPGFFGLQQLGDGDAPEPKLRAFQFVVAALNDDEEALFGLVSGYVMTADDEGLFTTIYALLSLTGAAIRALPPDDFEDLFS